MQPHGIMCMQPLINFIDEVTNYAAISYDAPHRKNAYLTLGKLQSGALHV